MKLQTLVDFNANNNFTFNYLNRGLIIGSCFAENIGNRLSGLGFNSVCNPFGVVYNPLSLARQVDRLMQISAGERYKDTDLVEFDGLWHSFDHHGSFSNSNKDAVLASINSCSTINTKFDYIIITLGSAWVYCKDGEVVANCHKFPAKEFIRKRLSVAECVEALMRTISLYPDAKFVFTVSPIRHIKDGLAENSLSKATLRCAIGEICERHKNCIYFPSFEIVMDELRDYRFYAEDMLHPSKQSVNYIFDRFSEAFFDAPTKEYIAEIDALLNMHNHRPLHSDSSSYTKFKATTASKIEASKKKYPHLCDTKIFY